MCCQEELLVGSFPNDLTESAGEVSKCKSAKVVSLLEQPKVSKSKKRVQGGRLPTIVLWWQAKKTNTRFNPATVHFSGHSMSKICAICGILHQEPCSIDWPPSTCRFYRLQAVGNWLLTKCNAWKHMKSRFIMHMTKTGLYASGPIPW